MFLRLMMRSQIPRVLFLVLFLCGPAAAELSITSKWRIEQAIQRCKETDNALSYASYWGDSVTDLNRETVCVAEHFAQLANLEGDEWLETNAPVFIRSCRVQSKKSGGEYAQCLQNGIKTVTQQLSSSCRELEEEGLWEEVRCKELISYIFIAKFDEILKAQRPLLTKAMDHKFLRILGHPVAAVLVLILFVMDVLIWIDPGNWMRVSEIALVTGIIISVSFFLEGPWRFLSAGVAILIATGAIIWNHMTAGMASQRKTKKKKQ
jgi:hypothetical protein